MATVGALVDDGLLDWDRPLRDYLPGLRLSDPVVTDRLSVADLLSHRSGLPRHDLAWLAHPGLTRAELVRRLRFLPLSRDLRQEFQYWNLGYLVAGHVDGDALRPRFGTMDLSLTHRHYETFDLDWHELGDESHPFPLMFLSGPDGDITAVTVPFEPASEPLRFDRLPDARARDPEVLRRLCGTYAMGPIEVTVALTGGGC